MKATKVSIVIVVILTMAGNVQAALTDGLVAHYPFDGTAADASGNGNDGTANGPSLTNDRFGAADSAYLFDGVDDYIQIGDKFNDITLPFSITAWINKSGPDAVYGIFTSDDTASVGTGNYYGFWFRIYNGNVLNLGFGDGTGSGLSDRRSKFSTSTIENDTWTFVAAVVRGPTDMDLYIDDADAGGYYQGTAGPMIHNTYDAVVGRKSRWGPEQFNGKIDDIRIYNRALSLTEVTELYQIPEPTTLLLLGFATPILLRLRARSQ